MNNIVYQDNHQNDNKTQLAQAGTTVKINKDNVVKEYDRRSPEYKAMYDSGKLMSYDKSTDTYTATPLKTVEVKTKAPQWLINKRNIEKNFTKEKFVKKYLPKWSGSMGETADNLSENAQKDYDKKVNDKLANVLLKSNQKKGNKEANNLDWYNSFSEKEREIIQQSSLANKFAPAQRAYDLDVSNSTKKYNTTDVLTDADKLSQSVQGTPERFRLFPNAENNIESYVNPGMFLGSMAKGLGNVPKDIKNENYGQAALSIATPLTVGALAGIGTQNTSQFVNNIVNPLAGTGDLVNNLGNKYLPNAHKLNPYAFRTSPKNFYRQVDNVTYNEGLESGLIRGKQDIDRTNGEEIINLNKSFGDDAYYNKGSLYYKNNKDLPYLFEAKLGEDKFIPKVNGRTRKYTTENTSVRVSKEPLPINDPNITIYKKDWLKGYKEIEIPKSNFKSEINWGKWNKEIPENKALMQEYNALEQQAKADGTWMKNPDGSAFNGTPEQFVQQNSENFQKAFGNSKLINPDGSSTISYHGTKNPLKEDKFNLDYFGKTTDDGWLGKGIYITPKKYIARNYSKNQGHVTDKSRIYELYADVKNPISTGDVNRTNLEKFFGREDDVFFKSNDAVIDDFMGIPGFNSRKKDLQEILIKNPQQLKSAIGNNGMFDMTNPNIYKTVVGALATGTLGKQAMEKKEFGGKILDTKIENGKKYYLINE